MTNKSATFEISKVFHPFRVNTSNDFYENSRYRAESKFVIGPSDTLFRGGRERTERERERLTDRQVDSALFSPDILQTGTVEGLIACSRSACM